MCAKRWSEIDFAHVPSLAVDRNKRAFLNENKNGEMKLPDDPERKACRENFIRKLVTGGIKGKQILPHELVAQVCSLHTLAFCPSDCFQGRAHF